MSVDLTRNFLRLLIHFRRQDLIAFAEEHSKLYEEARQSGNYASVTSHYYSTMSSLIDEYFGGNFHFTPPLRTTPNEDISGLTLEVALQRLHRRVGAQLKLLPGQHCLDVGCGIGGVMLDLVGCGVSLTGITISDAEVVMGNERFLAMGIPPDRCRIIQSNCQHMATIGSGSQDAAYAIYSLKYLPRLEEVMGEVARTLKSGGRFLVYDLLKTERYNPTNEEHRALLDGLQYACGMPTLHHRHSLIASAEAAGMELVEAVDLSEESGHPFYYCFVNSTIFMWLVGSPLIGSLIKAAEGLGILPRGFAEFNRIFLAGTVEKIVKAGELGIMSGAEILLFQKK